MTIAAILERAGLVPVVPDACCGAGTAPALAPQRVPAVPVVPAEKSRGTTKADGVDDPRRVRLLELVDRLGIDPAHVRCIPMGDLALWEVVLGDALRGLLLALDDAATRQAGKVPLNDTAAIHCARCGPVYVHPDIAAVLPVVNGWPHALGCPWCCVRKAGGYIPRPSVQHIESAV